MRRIGDSFLGTVQTPPLSPGGSERTYAEGAGTFAPRGVMRLSLEVSHSEPRPQPSGLILVT